jgi:hypothetical protein
MTDLEQQRAHVYQLLAEANMEWIRRRAVGHDRTALDTEIAALERKSRRLEEKIRKQRARTS